jgi:hypothetical protein
MERGFGEITNSQKYIPSSTTNLGERQLHAPHLTLVAKTIFADSLQFRVPKVRRIQSMHEHSSDLRQRSNFMLGTQHTVATMNSGMIKHTDVQTRTDVVGRGRSLNNLEPPYLLLVDGELKDWEKVQGKRSLHFGVEIQ